MTSRTNHAPRRSTSWAVPSPAGPHSERSFAALCDPNFSTIEQITAHSQRCSPRCSNTNRTARSRTSNEYIISLPITPLSPNQSSLRKTQCGSVSILGHQTRSLWKCPATGGNSRVRVAARALIRQHPAAGIITYTFLSCLPDPDHLAVLARPVVVRAASQPNPPLPDVRAALSFNTCPLRRTRGGVLPPPHG